METKSQTPPLRLDVLNRRILDHLAHSVAFDPEAIAHAVGAAKDVVAHRLDRLMAAGVLAGPGVYVNPQALGEYYEVLVSGTPTGSTDRSAIGRLCATAGVTRVFGLAASEGLAFTVIGQDPEDARKRGLELAGLAGLGDAHSALILSTFRDAFPSSKAAPGPGASPLATALGT